MKRTDLEKLERLVEKYRDRARDAGVTIESVTIGEALQFLREQEQS